MYTKWYSHIKDPEEQERFRNQVLSAKPVLERLVTLLETELDGLDRSETDIKSFDLPNWAYRQAYKNGARAELNMMTKLIDLNQQETK
jgi:hypothetical protein